MIANPTSPMDGMVAHHSDPQGTRNAVPLPWSCAVPTRASSRAVTPTRATLRAAPIPVESNMVEMNGHLALDADVTGPSACCDAEHFSGYIITT